MIRKISDALGQDLLVDEVDAEGIVGEIGKEILWKLIEAGGYKGVTDLVEHDMYGMSLPRVNQEIFKLERIGMCVREQYVDFDDKTKDTLFITAKGMITYKSLIGRSVMNTSEHKAIENAVSFEKLLGTTESYQEFVNKREIEKLIRSIKGFQCGEYRVNYIHYLKSNYEKGIASDHNRVSPYMENLIPERGFYHDLIFRMALHYDIQRYDALLTGEINDPNVEAEMEDLEAQLLGYQADPVVQTAEDIFKSEFPKIEEIDITDEGLLPPEPDKNPEETNRLTSILYPYWDSEQEIEECYTNPQNVFLSSLKEGHTSAFPTRWYSDEDIRKFITENLHAAETEEEKEIDALLKRINEMDPKTLSYYTFPRSWETNGLASMVRALYDLPYPEIDDEEDEEEENDVEE